VGSKIWNVPTTEDEAKQQILSSFLQQIKSTVEQTGFDHFSEEQLGSLVLVARSHAQGTGQKLFMKWRRHCC
jgi:hypothetical protein